MKKILIAEDDMDINNMVRDVLKRGDLQSVSAFSGTEALLVCDDTIDLVLLDLMLPGKSGQEVIKEIKEQFAIPVIVMTAVHDINVKLDLFKLGADDYITKPFDNQELLARIAVQLRHKNETETKKVLTHKNLSMDLTSHEVTCRGESLYFPKIEFDLLAVFLNSPTQVFTKSALFDLVWDTEYSADDNTLNVHISKIRNKLKEADPENEYIETVWSIGYKLSQN